MENELDIACRLFNQAQEKYLTKKPQKSPDPQPKTTYLLLNLTSPSSKAEVARNRLRQKLENQQKKKGENGAMQKQQQQP
ncbi:MAG TPA: hypothetical protein VFF49_06055, partial [Thermodesulfobacteriota bacterium]|nr:hypothetical protein [Thermodesulfobacteriota bacterium]